MARSIWLAVICETCDDGWTACTCLAEDAAGLLQPDDDCTRCNGHGLAECALCRGTGWRVRKPEAGWRGWAEVTFRLPTDSPLFATRRAAWAWADANTMAGD